MRAVAALVKVWQMLTRPWVTIMTKHIEFLVLCLDTRLIAARLCEIRTGPQQVFGLVLWRRFCETY
jgi:hypothetical protein